MHHNNQTKVVTYISLYLTQLFSYRFKFANYTRLVYSNSVIACNMETNAGSINHTINILDQLLRIIHLYTSSLSGCLK